jgi:hypothetical protein
MLKEDFDQMIRNSQLYKSLESQLKDKDRIIAEYHSLILPLHEWAHNNTAFKLGESITKRILEMAKSSVDKDKEIERLNHVIIDIKNSATIANLGQGKMKRIRTFIKNLIYLTKVDLSANSLVKMVTYRDSLKK